MSVNLKYKHQQKTYQLMWQELEKYGMAAFSYPTGCGKSFPPLKYIEDYLNHQQKGNTLIVVPYNIIADQFKDYIKQYVDNGNKRLKNKNIMVITYSKLALWMKYAKNYEVDIAIFDEAQMLGAETYEPAFEKLREQYPEAKLIAMTATPERMDNRNMLYEKFGEHVVYEMSLTEALSGSKEGKVILKAPKYVRVISQLKPLLSIYEEKIAKYNNPNRKPILLEKYQRLANIVSNAPGMEDVLAQAITKKNGKFIVYCKNREDMFKKMKDAKAIFGKVNDNIKMDYLLSIDSNGTGKTTPQNLKSLREFEESEYNDTLQLLFCVDMLNLGKHIDGEKLDGEVFFRETYSSQVYKQQMGRIMVPEDKGEQKIIIDAVNNWLRQVDAFDELVQAIGIGNGKNPENNYDLFKLTAEEIEFVDLLREIGEELRYNCFGTYEQIIEWLETHDGKMPQARLRKNGRYINGEELEENELEERKLYGRWLNCPEKKMLDKYIGIDIKDIPEEWQEKIQKLRSFGLGLKKKGVYERLLEWLDMHNGKMPKASATFRDENGDYIKSENLLPEQREGKNLYNDWAKSEEWKKLKKYIGVPIEEIPENDEWKEKIQTLREYGLGISLHEEYIDFLKRYGREPRQGIRRNGKTLGKNETTDEQKKEKSLYYRWNKSEEKKISDEYSGMPLDEVPENWRKKIEELRIFNVGTKDIRPLFEKMVEWLEIHNGRTPFAYNGIPASELNEELLAERTLFNEWINSDLKKTTWKYISRDLSEIPEEWREQVEKMRELGVGLDIFDEMLIWFNEGHKGKLPLARFCKDGHVISSTQMTEEQKKESSFSQRWKISPLKKALDTYADKTIDEIPIEWRNQISTLRKNGILGKTKQERITERLKKSVAKHVEDNSNVRGEIGKSIRMEKDKLV